MNPLFAFALGAALGLFAGCAITRYAVQPLFDAAKETER